MATTASCANAECPEFQVDKDMSQMPTGFHPVICGQCGVEIDVSGVDGIPLPNRHRSVPAPAKEL